MIGDEMKQNCCWFQRKAALIVAMIAVNVALLAGGAHALEQAGETQGRAAELARGRQSHVLPSGPHPRRATLMKRRWGVEVLGLRQAAGGYMLEFRFKVLNAKLAASLFDSKIRPQLIDSATGAAFIVPSPQKVGELRSVNPPEAGRTYWIMFANPGKFIKPGSNVSVVIGEFRAEALLME